jgi:hypothetical protein
MPEVPEDFCQEREKAMKTTLTEKAVAVAFRCWARRMELAEFDAGHRPWAFAWAGRAMALTGRLQREQARARAKLASRLSGCLEVALLGFLASETCREEARWATCVARLALVATKAGLDADLLALDFDPWVLEAALEIGSKP